jgi:menaquinone-dependent protoporphyrinogen IX oxidase
MQAPYVETSKRSKTLIVSADVNGFATSIAHAIGSRLRSLGHDVHYGDALVGRPPPPVDYDAVIIGTEHGDRRHRRVLGDYIARYREPLERLPTGLFVVNKRRSANRDPRQPIEAFETSVGWRPKYAAGIECGHIGIVRSLLRRGVHLILRHLDYSIAAESNDEIRALVGALERSLARGVRP